MSGLCGWIGRSSSDAPPEQLLSTMANGLASIRVSVRAGEAASDAGLNVQARLPTCSFDTGSGFLVALVGQPRWSSPQLADIAQARSHAAAVREAYCRHGPMFLHQLRGAFSLALIDRNKGEALLAIDRFGIHTMYYSVLPVGGLAFGSTAGSVHGHPDVTSTISLQAIYNYLCTYVVRAPKTIYQEQRKLLPAQYLHWSQGRARTEFYWRIPYEAVSRNRDRAEKAVELMRLLRQAVGRCLQNMDSATVGAFLSGGLDSSTVAGLLSEICPGKTFTVAFDSEGYDETTYARLAAQHFGTKQFEYRMMPRDVIEFAGKVAAAYDEPFGNSSALPAYCCARLAQQHDVNALLGGDGGDEIFAGNKRYVEQRRLDRYGRIPRLVRSGIIEPLLFQSSWVDRFSLVSRTRNHIGIAKLPLPDRLVAYDQYVPTAVDQMFETDVLAQIDREEPLAELREIYAEAPSDNVLQRMMYLDLRVALADNDLRKVQKTCELADVSVRFPMLDDDVVEFAAELPPEWLISGYRLRHFYKEALKDFLPSAVLAKKKHGFGMPYGPWVRSDAAVYTYVCDCLQAFKRRRYLRSEFMDKLADTREKDRPSAWDGLSWDIMMLELWLQSNSPSVRRWAR